MATKDLTFRLVGKDVSAGKTFDNVGKKSDGLNKKISALGGLLAGGALAAGLTKLGKDSVAAFQESERASAALDDALSKFPLTADRTRESFDKLNESLARKTKFDDDATASGQAVLAQFRLTGAQIQELTPLMQDFAAKTGRDIPTAATLLGKAMMGNTRALKEVGLNLQDTGTEAGNFEQLVSGLRNTVGGFAAVEGKTAAGQTAILKNQFGELQEQIGGRLTPALMQLGSGLLSTIDFVSRNQTAVLSFAAAIGALGTAVLIGNAALAVSAAGGLALWLKSTRIAVGLTGAWAAAQWVLNAALTANPIGVVVMGLAALTTGLVVAYKNSETFREVVSTAFAVVRGYVNSLRSALGWVVDKIAWVIDKGSDVAGVAKKVAKYTPTGLAVRGAGKLIDGFRADGGPVRAGGAYIVGERGPELFTPRSSGSVVPNHQLRTGGGVVVNINGPVYGADADVLARQSARALQHAKVNGRRVGLA